MGVFLIIFGAFATVVGFASLVFLLVSLYLFLLHKKYDHLPGPERASFFFGHIPLIKENIMKGRELQELSNRYDGVYVSWFGGWHPSVTLSHPDALREAIIKYNLPKPVKFYQSMSEMFGVRFMKDGLVTIPYHEVWKKKRMPLIQLSFAREHLKTLISSFNQSCDLFIETLKPLADGKTEVCMLDQFHRITMDVIMKVAFSLDLKTLDDKDSTFPKAVNKMLEAVMFRFRNPWHKYDPRTFKYQREVANSLRMIRETGRNCIAERQAAIVQGEEIPNDILSTIMKLELQGLELDIEELLDDFVTFFIAGQETTANQLSFALLEIGLHPDITHKVVEEVDKVIGSHVDFVEYDDLANLSYMTQVLKETLRKYPPAAGVIRHSPEEITLNGHVIPAGTGIGLNIYGAHHNPTNWKDPEVFDPERFNAENAPNIKPFTFLPFSLGPRSCIGQHFAQFEAKVLLARFLQKFRIKLCPGQTTALRQTGTLQPRDGVMCLIEKR
ncbi:predicted protein [Nematostella vectensis]|uniref:Cholesterol 24-hydroxylase n=1 Tax=Nematostella vectensis TaxID=45351 RepID=A7RNE6_NEMVE|nr:predicted protein [Nematostella vectensis]|eukprot:XP_001639192.1 predicted protein [Nematostella vectensis]